jgi:hypothetical protein
MIFISVRLVLEDQMAAAADETHGLVVQGFRIDWPDCLTAFGTSQAAGDGEFKPTFELR